MSLCSSRTISFCSYTKVNSWLHKNYCCLRCQKSYLSWKKDWYSWKSPCWRTVRLLWDCNPMWHDCNTCPLLSGMDLCLSQPLIVHMEKGHLVAQAFSQTQNPLFETAGSMGYYFQSPAVSELLISLPGCCNGGIREAGAGFGLWAKLLSSMMMSGFV